VLLTEFAGSGMKFFPPPRIADPDGMDDVKSGKLMLALLGRVQAREHQDGYPVRGGSGSMAAALLPVETVVGGFRLKTAHLGIVEQPTPGLAAEPLRSLK